MAALGFAGFAQNPILPINRALPYRLPSSIHATVILGSTKYSWTVAKQNMS